MAGNGGTRTVKTVRFHATGGPEVLEVADVELPPPGPGEVQVNHGAIGLNFIDCYFRSGLYPVDAFAKQGGGGALPFVPGMEGAGTVAALGEGVDTLAVGDRVAYGLPPPGAYAAARTYRADRLVRLPDSIDDSTAAAMMLKGLTVYCLLHRTYRVQRGDVIVWHAAAGGVGLIACQWARHLGATVIGTVGSDAKAEIARAHGCEYPLVLGRDDVVATVRDLTGGEGVPAVYDSVGRTTFDDSLRCVRRLGTLAVFGTASGPIPPFDVSRLQWQGSAFLTRAGMFNYIRTPAELAEAAAALLEVVANGAVRIAVNQTYALADAATAHADLEGRRTTGSTVLLP
jgi:NADPH2:quinone reductase